jgi:hypothetical protein
MPRCDALVLRLHPNDPDLLEVMLREGDSERRVARAPSSNPRAWEWTTPPSWLRAESVEALIDAWERVAHRCVRMVLHEIRAGYSGGPLVLQGVPTANDPLAEVPVSAPVGSLARMARQQAAALATLGARTGEFVQVRV